jgi:hypothetical protein
MLRFILNNWGKIPVIIIGFAAQLALYTENARAWQYWTTFAFTCFLYSLAAERIPRPVAQIIATIFSILLLLLLSVLETRDHDSDAVQRSINWSTFCALHVRPHYGPGQNTTYEIWAAGRYCGARTRQPGFVSRAMEIQIKELEPACYTACMRSLWETSDGQWRGWITTVPEYQKPSTKWCGGSPIGKCGRRPKGSRVISFGSGEDDMPIELPAGSRVREQA